MAGEPFGDVPPQQAEALRWLGNLVE